jgi:hypothetical protein
MIDNGEVYHLVDGILVQERRDGATHYYLIESTKADYELADYEITEDGLKIEIEIKGKGTIGAILHRSPEGSVTAWFSDFIGDGPEGTIFTVDDEKFSDVLQMLTPSITVRDIYNQKL